MPILLYLAFLVQFFSFEGEGNALPQVVPILILFAEALRVLLFASFKASEASGKYVLFLLALIPIQSFLMGVWKDNEGTTLFTLIFLFAGIASYVIVTSYGLKSVALAYQVACLTFSFVLVAFSSDLLLASLLAEGDQIGISRLTAYGLHPNLYGHIYAISFVVSVWLTFDQSNSRRFIGWLGVVISLLIISAASSRGALVAAGAGGVVVYLMGLLGGNKRLGGGVKIRSAVVMVGVVVMLLGIVLKSLDLDSEYRGSGSGFSGRTDNWVVLWDVITASPISMLLGGGFRSYDPTVNAVHTDNSYINFALEFGVPMAILLVGILFLKAIELFRLRRIDEAALGVGVLASVLVESLFSRYLVGIGNPASLFVLMVVLCSVKRRE